MSWRKARHTDPIREGDLVEYAVDPGLYGAMTIKKIDGDAVQCWIEPSRGKPTVWVTFAHDDLIRSGCVQA